MPRTPSSPADRPKWLRFEAGDEESHELFAPGANWRKQDQYPVLKPLDSYTRDDYLRLAWELLRRMPRCDDYNQPFCRASRCASMRLPTPSLPIASDR